jgi:hypothetical protein
MSEGQEVSSESARSIPEKHELWLPQASDERRTAAWKSLLLGGLTEESFEAQDLYRSLSQIPCSFDDVIQRDVGRTLPKEELFKETCGRGQTALFRLLRALAIQHGDIGYVQSLNFVVATLINVFPDDEPLVFNCTKSLLFRHSLVDFYRPSFPKLGVALWQFDRLVEGFLPKAHAALHNHGITAEFYAMQWFLTLFASDLPQRVVVRIWDRFLLAGWQVIAQVALALVAEVQEEIWTLESCAAMTLLKKFTHVRRFDPEALLESAAKFDVSHRMLSDLEAAYSRYEDPEDTRLVVDIGISRWSVQRRASPKLRRSSSNRSIGSNSEPLPRAFDDHGSAYSSPRLSASSTRSGSSSGSGKEIGNGTLLPFLIHNLDTGETTLLEEEWTEYLQQRSSPAPGVAPTLLNQLSLHTANSAKQSKLGGACGGSFWMQGQQLQALRTLGKA